MQKRIQANGVWLGHDARVPSTFQTDVMNIPQTSSFHLIPESVVTQRPGNGSGHETRSSASPVSIEVPSGCSFLAPSSSDSRSLLSPLLEWADGVFVLEPVLNGERQLRLLLVSPMPGCLRVNDSLAPRVALLRERDQFQFDDTCMFHVAIFHRPQTGQAPADKVGKPCPICLTPFTDDLSSACYCCPCGTVLHLQDPSGLECARAVHDCPHCHQPILLKEGYSWLPNLDS